MPKKKNNIKIYKILFQAPIFFINSKIKIQNRLYLKKTNLNVIKIFNFIIIIIFKKILIIFNL